MVRKLIVGLYDLYGIMEEEDVMFILFLFSEFEIREKIRYGMISRFQYECLYLFFAFFFVTFFVY